MKFLARALFETLLLVTGNAAFAQDTTNLLPGWICDSDGDGIDHREALAIGFAG